MLYRRSGKDRVVDFEACRALPAPRRKADMMITLAGAIVVAAALVAGRGDVQEQAPDPAAHLPEVEDTGRADSESWKAARERAERRARLMAPPPGEVAQESPSALPPQTGGRVAAGQAQGGPAQRKSSQARPAVATPALSPADKLARDELAAQGYACSDEIPALACPKLESQIKTGRVKPGVYLQCATVSGAVDFQGSWLKDKACGRKAALIAKGGAVIENVTISGQSDGTNLACVRLEGGDIAIRGMTCRHTDTAILGNAGHVVIENSLLESVMDSGPSLNHIVYANSADILEIRGTTVRDPGHRGHALKTGARRTIIENSTIEAGEREYSRIIDAFNGGELILRNTVLRVGSHGGNGDVIGFGGEMRTRFDVNRVEMSGGVIDCRAGKTWNVLHIWQDKVLPDIEDFQPGEVLGCPAPPTWWQQMLPGFLR